MIGQIVVNPSPQVQLGEPVAAKRLNVGALLASQIGRQLTPFEVQQIDDARRTIERQKAREESAEQKELAVGIMMALFSVATSAAARGLVPSVVPKDLVPLAMTLVDIFWQYTKSAVLRREIGASIMQETLKQSQRAIASFVDPAVQSGRLGISVPKDLSRFGGDVNLFRLDAAQRVADLAIAQPVAGVVEDVLTQGSPFATLVLNGGAIAQIENVDPDEGLRRVGADPEQLARRYARGVTACTDPARRITCKTVTLEIREDVAAMAINAGLNDYLYNVDWFDPVSGRFITDFGRLTQLRDEAAKRPFPNPKQLAVLDRRIAAARMKAAPTKSESGELYDAWRVAVETGAPAAVVDDLVRRLRAATASELDAHQTRVREAEEDMVRACTATPTLAECVDRPTPADVAYGLQLGLTGQEFRRYTRWLERQPKDAVWPPEYDPAQPLRPPMRGSVKAFKGWEAIGAGAFGPGDVALPAPRRQTVGTTLKELAMIALLTSPLWGGLIVLPKLRARFAQGRRPRPSTNRRR